ncbi:MAG: hypothetical protein NVS9B7_23220 [Flavisolibacter sp.]
MKQETPSKTFTSISLISALAASLCCITPVLALFAGISGAASFLSWLEPARPYLIGLAIATLVFAWYRSFNSQEKEACGTDGNCVVQKTSFLGSRTFLIIITVAAIALIAFPYYAKFFYGSSKKQKIVVVANTTIQTVSFTVKGMNCQACEREVNNELYKVAGVIDAQTIYNKGISTVRFDKSKATVQQVQNALAQSGYKVINHKILN